MIPLLALHTYRECTRRPFPYVAAVAVILLTLASRFFLVFTFGAARTAAFDLVISAVFLVGFLQAAFQGTALVRADLERGTLGLLLTTPSTLRDYVIGRFAGLSLSVACLCAIVGAAATGILALFPPDPEFVLLDSVLFAGCGRAVLCAFVFGAASLAASALASAVAAPLILLALFAAGSMLGHLPFVPDFALFGLEAGAGPPWAPLVGYTAIYASLFLAFTLIVLGRKQALRGDR